MSLLKSYRQVWRFTRQNPVNLKDYLILVMKKSVKICIIWSHFFHRCILCRYIVDKRFELYFFSLFWRFLQCSVSFACTLFCCFFNVLLLASGLFHAKFLRKMTAAMLYPTLLSNLASTFFTSMWTDNIWGHVWLSCFLLYLICYC